MSSEIEQAEVEELSEKVLENVEEPEQPQDEEDRKSFLKSIKKKRLYIFSSSRWHVKKAITAPEVQAEMGRKEIDQTSSRKNPKKGEKSCVEGIWRFIKTEEEERFPNNGTIK